MPILILLHVYCLRKFASNLLCFLSKASAAWYLIIGPSLDDAQPSEESFDAKKELKRVMRGHHLPDDHVSEHFRNSFTVSAPLVPL